MPDRVVPKDGQVQLPENSEYTAEVTLVDQFGDPVELPLDWHFQIWTDQEDIVVLLDEDGSEVKQVENTTGVVPTRCLPLTSGPAGSNVNFAVRDSGGELQKAADGSNLFAQCLVMVVPRVIMGVGVAFEGE